MVSVAQGAVREAASAGHVATLLLALEPTGHAVDYGHARLDTLGSTAPYVDIPARLIAWLKANPQDVLIFNGCEQADTAIPFVPAETRIVYAVHDTAQRYFLAALDYEADIDRIVAVSETVAAQFRRRLSEPAKLSVIHNGTEFPKSYADVLATERDDDLMFLGGDNPIKGAHDVLALWPLLLAAGFGGRLHWFGQVDREFAALIEALPANDRIIRHGRQPRAVIFEVAALSKVVLILSRTEPFGMATVECMGMGCLTAAWDIATGTKEIVRQGEGIFAPLGNFVLLARGVMTLIDLHSHQLAARMLRIREAFNEEAMWSRYSALCSSFAAEPAIFRSRVGETPPPYRQPLRYFQLLPKSLRSRIRTAVGRSTRLGYLLRDFRGL